MNAIVSTWILRTWILGIYPKSFRDRYGDEITMLLESSATPRRDLLNVFWHGLLDRAGAFFDNGWRRTPRYLAYAVAWLFGAYLAADLMGRFTTVVLRMVNPPQPRSGPGVPYDITVERLAILGCIIAAAAVGYALSRMFWRGTPAAVIAGVALTSVFVSVVRLDTYVWTSIHAYVSWDGFWLTALVQAAWVVLATLLVLLLRRTPRPGWVAPLAVVGLAYAHAVVAGALVNLVYDLPANPLTTYWRSLIGDAVFIVTGNGLTGVAVLVDGWWTTVSMALVAGCTLAARRAPRTAHSPELVS